MASNYKLDQFLSSLEGYCGNHGFKSSKWYGGAKSTPNLVHVMGSKPMLLYVKESNIGEGFWGVNENQIEALEDSGYQWALVLLLGPTEAAYVLSGAQVMNAIKNSLWSRGKHDYKVHEGDELSEALKASNYTALFDSLFA